MAFLVRGRTNSATAPVACTLLTVFASSIFSLNPATAADMAVKALQAEPAPAAAPSDWQYTLDEDTRFYTWSGTRGFPASPAGAGGGGWQLYVPVSIDAIGKTSPSDKWEFQVRSGYVWSNQTTPGQSGSFADITDTTTAGTYTYLGLNGIQPYVSLALNLPTGRSALFGSAPNARMDPDLVGISVYGEGFNVGPTIGANIPVGEAWMFGASAGYTYRGSYAKDALINPATFTPFTGATSNLKPGDDFTLGGSVAYTKGALYARLFGSVVFETDTNVSGILNGVPYSGGLYRTGNVYQLQSLASYDWFKYWTSVLVGSWSHTDRNQVLAADLPPLVAEMFDSQTDVFQASLYNKFQVSSKLNVGPTLGVLYRTNNSWVSTSNQFVAAKTKWTVGGLATYNLFEKLALVARLEHYWINQGADPGLLLPSLADSGWLMSLGGTFKW
jgi:hypothetical protein